MSFPQNPQNPSEKNPSDSTDLLKSVLPPLLEDFQHWFGRSIELLETKDISFLLPEQQQSLLTQVKTAQSQVSAAQALSAATNSQAGIEMPVVMAWHKLMHDCWGIAMRYRREHPESPGGNIGGDTGMSLGHTQPTPPS